jgi:transposase
MVRGPYRTRRDRRAVQVRFVDLLAGGELTVPEAAAAAGVALPTLQTWRQRDPEFAAAWRRAIHAGRVARLNAVLATPYAAGRRMRAETLAMDSPQARQQVLDLVSEGGTEPYAARRLGVDAKTVWRWRRDPEFDAQWRAAHKAGSLALLEMAKQRFARLCHAKRHRP